MRTLRAALALTAVGVLLAGCGLTTTGTTVHTAMVLPTTSTTTTTLAPTKAEIASSERAWCALIPGRSTRFLVRLPASRTNHGAGNAVTLGGIRLRRSWTW